MRVERVGFMQSGIGAFQSYRWQRAFVIGFYYEMLKKITSQ